MRSAHHILVPFMLAAICLFPAAGLADGLPDITTYTSAPILRQIQGVKPISSAVELRVEADDAPFFLLLDKVEILTDGERTTRPIARFKAETSATGRPDEPVRWEGRITESFGNEPQERVSLECALRNLTFTRGPFKTGDEVMPLVTDGLVPDNMDCLQPEDARGFILQGRVDLNGDDCYLLAVQVDDCRIGPMGSGSYPFKGSLSGVILIHVESGLPILQELSMELTLNSGKRIARQHLFALDQ